MRQFLFAAFALGCFLAPMVWAEAHDGMHDEWYQSLEVPNSNHASCCNMVDCKPVKDRINKDGNYEVWIDNVTFPDNVLAPPQGHAPNDWVVVPKEAILYRDNPTGEPIACFYQGVVRCFVPGVGT